LAELARFLKGFDAGESVFGIPGLASEFSILLYRIAVLISP